MIALKEITYAACLMMAFASCGGDSGPNNEPINPTPTSIAVIGVTLNKSSISLLEGNSDDLTATISPTNATNKNLSWKSSDESIAKVDAAGKVTAVKPGNATISVTTSDGSKVATCIVDVKPKTVGVINVSLNKETMDMNIGDKDTLTIKVDPDNASNKEVIWKSSDTKIATVDEYGIVTAVASGFAAITVTTKEGNKSATCKVNVKNNTTKISSIKLSDSSLIIVVGKTATLKATVQPSSADASSLTWSSSNKSIATVENGVVSAISPGLVTITCKGNDDSKAEAKCAVTITSTPPLNDGGEW